MSKVRISQAEQMTGKSRATIYRDIENGRVPAQVDERGVKVIEVAELQRFYGHLTMQNETQREKQLEKMEQDEKQGTEDDKAKMLIETLQKQVEVLTTQLEQATERETFVLQMLATEQEKTKMLMLPTLKKKWGGWLQKLGFYKKSTTEFTK